MSDTDRTTAELLAALCDETISSDEMARLDRMIRADGEVRRRYLEYLDLHARLSYSFHRPAEIGGGGLGAGGWDSEVADAPLATSLPALSTTHYPLPTTFIGGPLFSYMAATVILCVMLLGGWVYKISHDNNTLATNSRRSTTSGPSGRSELVFVGRITGMKDCQWSDPETKMYIGASTPLEREYVLASGCLEITYISGARVILEGPCSFKIESSSGGFLKHGKLTARIEHQGPAASTGDAKPQALFSVLTPTASIIDLGTEFGVAVAENGDTTSYVFQGTVRVEALAGTGTASGTPATLSAGESVMVSRVRETHQESTTMEKVRFTHTTNLPTFVRTLARPIEQLDLLDVIAGGNGLGRRRERGLDPTTGMEDPIFVLGERIGDGKYHSVQWHKLIDGVFVPGNGPMQINSIGGTFNGFPKTTGNVWGSIWPRSAQVDPESERTGWIYEIHRCERYMPEQLGIVGVCQNGGITFDLAAVREMCKGVRPARLRAIAGRGERIGYDEPYDGLLDLWVIVDGEARWKRIGLRHSDGPVEIDVELTAADRFLTLAVTDGGDGGLSDWVVIGDPVLKLEPIEKP